MIRPINRYFRMIASNFIESLFRRYINIRKIFKLKMFVAFCIFLISMSKYSVSDETNFIYIHKLYDLRSSGYKDFSHLLECKTAYYYDNDYSRYRCRPGTNPIRPKEAVAAIPLRGGVEEIASDVFEGKIGKALDDYMTGESTPAFSNAQVEIIKSIVEGAVRPYLSERAMLFEKLRVLEAKMEDLQRD